MNKNYCRNGTGDLLIGISMLSLKSLCWILVKLPLLCHFPQISDLLEVLADVKPSPCDGLLIDPRNISSNMAELRRTRSSFRSRATLPPYITQLSQRRFQRRDFLSEISSGPVSAEASSASDPLVPTHPVKKTEVCVRCGSISSITRQRQNPEIQSKQQGMLPGEILKSRSLLIQYVNHK